MRILHFVVLVILISSCNGGNDHLKNAIKADTTINEDCPFRGTWVIEKYIDSLIHTRSAFRSQGNEYFMCFPKSMKDTVYSFVYHEGGAQYNLVKYGQFYFLKNIGQYSDSAGVVVLAGGKKLRIGKDIFVKTIDSVGVPEQVLFKGEYQLGDKTVFFSDDGRIVGLDSVRYYSIQNDYIGPGYGHVDIIFLGNTKVPQSEYCFEFDADTLLIYDVKFEEQDIDGCCLDLEKGTLRYKLITNKK